MKLKGSKDRGELVTGIDIIVGEGESVDVKMSVTLVPVSTRMLELVIKGEPLLVQDKDSPGMVKLRGSKDRNVFIASGKATVDEVARTDAVTSAIVDGVERMNETMSGTESSCLEVDNCINTLPVLGLVNDEPNPVGSLYTCEPDTIYNG